MIDLLHENKVIVVRGNHEEDGRDFEKTLMTIPETHRDWAKATVEWLVTHLDPGTLEAMCDLPLTHVIEAGIGHSIIACHAGPDNNRAWVTGPDVDSAGLERTFGSLPQEIVVHGHFHQHHVQFAAGKLLVNVACVGMRYDGLASFTLLDLIGGRWIIGQHHATYDVDGEWRLIKKRRAPLPNFDFLYFPLVFGGERRLQ